MTELILVIVILIFAVLLVQLFLNIKSGKNISLPEIQGFIRDTIDKSNDEIEKNLREEFTKTREESYSFAKQNREELNSSFKLLSDSFFNRMFEISNLQKSQLETFRENLNSFTKTVDEKMESFRDGMDNRLQSFQNDSIAAAKQNREELSASLKAITETLTKQLSEMTLILKNEMNLFSEQLSKLTQTNELKLDQVKDKIEERLKGIEENNAKKLDEMRNTVDEKLQTTLEKRLGESFKLVSDRLEQVYKGLGDMQELARGVGDLKNVLINVKTRGTWGEIQLENLIDQILTREQYEKNVATKMGSNDKVEIAIKLPGRDNQLSECVWLPIDAKFPIEDYQRMQLAQEAGNTDLINEAAKAIEQRIKLEAKKIADKYVSPPGTTDFAIMFLPIEGLFAEVIRRPGLADTIQRDYRVTVAGPTTLTALLNSLQMGFRTLAIEKRSGEVWNLLSLVKTDFGKFGEVLEKTQKKLQEASNTIEDAARKSRTIERRLKDVQALPAAQQLEIENETEHS
jgi:DNA recombination protein RmuC